MITTSLTTQPAPPLPSPILTSLLEATSEAVVVYDSEFRIVHLNQGTEQMAGMSRDRLLGKVIWEVFSERAAPFREPLMRAMVEQVPVTFEIRSPLAGRWVEGRCVPLKTVGNVQKPGDYTAGQTSGSVALAVFFRDVTERHEVVQARDEAEVARERMSFLAQVSAILSSSLDYQTTLESMAHVVVPDLCDWCAVQMPSADGTLLEQVAVAHADPERVRWARELNRRYPARIEETHGTAQVLRTGEMLFLPDIPEEVLVAGAKDEEHLRIIRGLGFRSAVAVPLIARGRTLGVLLLVTTEESGRKLTADDAAFAQELAARAAIAVDNARLFRESQEAEQEVRRLLQHEHNIAERLQEALQPRLPGKLPLLDVEAYYQPALREASIGGDFYDVFAVEKGCIAFVVADLSGKGLAAASQVATVRHMFRALLYEQKNTIASVVTRLNAMLTEHDLLTGFATLFAGVYDVNGRTLTYVNAGQEPGLVLRKESGEVEELWPSGPVLGGFSEATFTQKTITVTSGDVMALFTDGLTEAGPSRKDLLRVSGVTAIFETAATNTASAKEITLRMIQGVEEVATPAGIRDDVCLLVVRVE